MGRRVEGNTGEADRGGRSSRLLAAALSAVIPGVGQIYAGRRRRAAWYLIVVLAVATVVVVIWLNDPKTLLKLAFDPTVLVWLLFANAALFVFRIVAAVDAYRSPTSAADPRWAVRALIPVIALVLVVPHAWFAYYDGIQFDLINTLFAGPTTTTTSTTTTTTTAAPPTSEGQVATTPAPTTTSTTTTTTTEPPAPWAGRDRLNILLLGGDAGVGRTGVRTDTMILASVDVNTGDLALISIPRNFAQVPVPDDVDVWSCHCFPDILNALYIYGENHPDSFPGPATPGANAIKGAVSELTGLPVDYYALVDLDGFVDIIDAIGGVTITVTERVFDPAYPSEDGGTEPVNWEPGTYKMDGHQALTYARTRYSDNDYHRMSRQRCVIEAVLQQVDPFDLLRNFPTLADVIKKSVETDIPLDAVPDLIDLMSMVNTDEAVSLRLVPPTYVSGHDANGYNIPDVDLIQKDVKIATTLSPAEAMAQLGIDPVEDSCG